MDSATRTLTVNPRRPVRTSRRAPTQAYGTSAAPGVIAAMMRPLPLQPPPLPYPYPTLPACRPSNCKLLYLARYLSPFRQTAAPGGAGAPSPTECFPAATTNRGVPTAATRRRPKLNDTVQRIPGGRAPSGLGA